MAHPVRPASYMEISNFYTATVYEKGAEVVRMIHTLIGAQNFRKGMDLYFERHDGQAVRTEEFVQAMQDASGVDLTQFRRWYEQAGTPVLDVHGHYDASTKRYSLAVEQSCPPTPGQDTKLPLHIPFAVGLVAADGSEIPLQLAGEAKASAGTRVLSLKKQHEKFEFVNVQQPAVPSLLRGFSAQVDRRGKTAQQGRHRRLLAIHEFEFFMLLLQRQDPRTGTGLCLPSQFPRNFPTV